MTGTKLSSPVRGLAVLIVVGLGAAAMTPSFSAFNPTKKKVKRIATKQAAAVLNDRIDDVGNPLFIEEGKEVGIIAPVRMSWTDTPDATVATFGPFTITMNCRGVSGPSVFQTLYVDTSEDNSHVSRNDDAGIHLDAASPPAAVIAYSGNGPGGDSASDHPPGHLVLEAPGGTRVFLVLNPITNFNGAHCYVDGWFLDAAA